LESVVKMNDGDNRQSVSHRCADMDVKVPQLMGVSRAILENVIFCHQEESNWPLNDQSVLKKKFDDIFGATRYTKALKHLQELQKDVFRQHKEKKQALELLGKDLDQANRFRQRQELLIARAQVQKDELEKKNEQLEAANTMHQQAETRRKEFGELALALETTKRMQDHCRQQLVGIHIPRKLEMSLGELEEQRWDLDAREARRLKEKMELGNLAQQMEKELQELDMQARRTREELAELEASERLMVKAKEKLQEMWKNCGKFQGNYEGQASLKQIDQACTAAQQALTSAERENTTNETNMRNKLKQSSADVAQRQQMSHQVEMTCNELKNNLQRVRREMEDYRDAEAKLAQVQDEMRKHTSTDDGETKQIKAISQKLSDMAQKKHSLQFKIQQKQESVRQLELQSEQLAEIDVLKRQAREAESMVVQHRNNAPTSVSIPIDTNVVGLKGRIDTWFAQQEIAVREKRQETQDAKSKLVQCQAQLTCLQREEEDLNQQIREKERMVGAMTLQEMESQISDAQQSYEEAATNAQYSHAASDFFNSFLKSGLKKNACQFCKRSFANDQEKNEMKTNMELLKLRVTPDKQEENARKKEEAERHVQKLQDMKTHVAAIAVLKNKRQLVLKQHEDMQEKVSNAMRIQEKASAELDLIMNQMTAAEAWRNFANELERVTSRSNEINRRVKDQQACLVETKSESLADEREALFNLSEERETISRKEDSARNELRTLEQRRHQQQLHLEKRKKEEALALGAVERRKNLALEEGRMKQELDGKIEPLRKAQEEALRAESSHQARQAAFDKESATKNTHLRALADEANKTRDFAQRMRDIQREVQEHEQKMRNADHERERLKQVDRACEGAKTKVQGHRLKIDEVATEIAQIADEKSNLHANVEAKKMEAQLGNYGKQEREAQERLGGINEARLEAGVARAQEEVSRLMEERGTYTGALQNVERELGDVRREMSSTMYKDIDERHRHVMIEAETRGMAARDLQKFHAALDRALMKFHASKMADINKSIRDMWQQIYRGIDIEYIQIRSDADDVDKAPHAHASARSTSSASGRAGSKSHNYRVVMVNSMSHAEIDMRGRCSAGQKVLASLVIRLALADAFGSQCGILSLDEPTTNLDQANIEALASTLADLIAYRSKSDSFQLMIITHDEQFVSMLARRQVCERYWRVSKTTKGHSMFSSDDIKRLLD